MSRVWYWVWSILEMLEKYGKEVPDVDIVMQVEDLPKVRPTWPCGCVFASCWLLCRVVHGAASVRAGHLMGK